MNLREIKEELLKAAALVEDFSRNHLEIDRDAALNKIRQAYESLRFMDGILEDDASTAEVEPLQEVADEPFEPEPEVEVEFIMPELSEDTEVEVESEPEFEPEQVVEPETVEAAEVEPEVVAEEPAAEVEPEVEAVEPDVAFEPEDSQEEAAEEVAPEVISEPTIEAVEPEVEPAPAPEPAPTPEPVVEPKRVVVEPSLFGDYEPIAPKRSSSRRKIMALYEDEPVKKSKVEVDVAPKSEPEPIAAPVVEPKVEAVDAQYKVLGEVIAPTTTTIADTIAPVASVADDRPIETLRGAISVVDRFMLIRDLFGDDAQLYEQTIDELEKMDNLDDCIIYIAENFAWRPSSEGAKLIMDLLQRKLG
jgi:hypothetical protein